VLRDALTGAGADAALAAELKPRLTGLRRRPGAPDTSQAHAQASAFGVDRLREASERAEPPLEPNTGLPDRRTTALTPSHRSLPA
jgi:hypothetical protein